LKQLHLFFTPISVKFHISRSGLNKLSALPTKKNKKIIYWRISEVDFFLAVLHLPKSVYFELMVHSSGSSFIEFGFYWTDRSTQRFLISRI